MEGALGLLPVCGGQSERGCRKATGIFFFLGGVYSLFFLKQKDTMAKKNSFLFRRPMFCSYPMKNVCVCVFFKRQGKNPTKLPTKTWSLRSSNPKPPLSAKVARSGALERCAAAAPRRVGLSFGRWRGEWMRVKCGDTVFLVFFFWEGFYIIRGKWFLERGFLIEVSEEKAGTLLISRFV